MATFLDLVNKVLEESGKEQNLLDNTTWDSDEAGRRLYPRVKRLVREAWRVIQMSRNEWEFNTGRVTLQLLPSIKFVAMDAVDAPTTYTWVGQSSGVTLTIDQLTPDYLDSVGEGAGNATITIVDPDNRNMVIGETFKSDDDSSTFVYNGAGYHSINEAYTNRVREPRWDTMRLSLDGDKFYPLRVVPYDNYLVTTNTSSIPYAAKDYRGNLVLFAQLKKPALLEFDFDFAPQSLEEYDEVPEGLPAEYHDWIAWEALANLARYDKDPILLGYAQSMVDTYKRRAERNLLPTPTWAASAYNAPRESSPVFTNFYYGRY